LSTPYVPVVTDKLQGQLKKGEWSGKSVQIADTATDVEIEQMWELIAVMFPSMDRSKLQAKDVLKVGWCKLKRDELNAFCTFKLCFQFQIYCAPTSRTPSSWSL
jgi:hypothetical protein